MDVVLLIARLGLAAVFLVAATAKALDQPQTRETLQAFGLRAWRARLGAPALPATEALVALALLVAATAQTAAVAAVVMLGVFAAAIARAARAGKAPECQCFGQLGSAPAGRGALARNAALAALGLLVAIGGHGAAVPVVVPVLVAALAVAAAVLSHRTRPGTVGRPAPDWALEAQDGGDTVGLASLAGAEGPLLLIFVSANCGPCDALLTALRLWPLDDLPPVVVLTAGPMAPIDGVRVLAADRDLRDAYAIAGTPGGVMVDRRGRIASRPALGGPAVEALACARGAGDRAHEVTLQGFAATAYGIDVEVVADTEDVARAAHDALPSAARIGTPVDGRDSTAATRWTVLTRGTGATLYRDGAFAGRTASHAAILELLAAAIRLHVAELAPERAFVHTGVVAWRGRAILLPGRSFTGKSTLVTALLRAGATYLSDEYAVLDDSGRVHPFLKPIALRAHGQHVSSDHDTGEFTSRAPADGPVRVGAIVHAPYEPGATWQPEPVSSAAGAMLLVSNAVGIRRAPARVMAGIRAAAEGVVALDAPRGEGDETARALLAHLDALVHAGTAARTEPVAR